MIELLQQYFNQSDHYLIGHLIMEYEQVINSSGLVYNVRVENMCEASGYETVQVPLDDILVFLYLNRK